MSTHICEFCKKEHDGSYGSGRFCSALCKQRYVSNSDNKVHVCRYCLKEFKVSYQLGAHVRNCGKNPNAKIRQKKASETKARKRNVEDPMMDVKLKCKQCNKEYSLCLRQSYFDKQKYSHFCSSRCARQYATRFVDYEKVKAGMKKSTKVRIIKCSRCNKEVEVSGSISNILCQECRSVGKIVRKYVKDGKYRRVIVSKCYVCGKAISSLRKTCCKEHEKILRIQSFKKTCARTHSVGGLRNNGGKGKRGWYKGIHCDSSWELAWVLYSLDNKVLFKRNKQGFEYEFDGNIRKYYPDFILSDGSFVEIKGWNSDRWQAKLNAFPKDKKLRVYYFEDLKDIFSYVHQKYGNDFTRMYEKT